MTRVPHKNVEDVDADTRQILEHSPINLFAALANNPGVLKQWFEFGEWIRWRSTLEPRLRELAILEVGACASNDYEFSHHVRIGRAFGVTEDDLAGLKSFAAGGASAHFSGLELAVLRAARELTLTSGLSAELWRELEGHLDHSMTLELVVVIGFYNMVVRVLAAIDLDVEPEYEQFLAFMPTTASCQPHA